jgi:hypothetical protein
MNATEAPRPPHKYRADITAGALKLPESRVIADLLLSGLNDDGWNKAIVFDFADDWLPIVDQ